MELVCCGQAFSQPEAVSRAEENSVRIHYLSGGVADRTSGAEYRPPYNHRAHQSIKSSDRPSVKANSFRRALRRTRVDAVNSRYAETRPAALFSRQQRQQAAVFAARRAMLCIRGTSHGPVSVRTSVCPSVTSRSSTKTAKRRITQTTPHDSPGTLVFLSQRSPRNSTGVTPYGGAKCRWGGSKSSTFDK